MRSFKFIRYLTIIILIFTMTWGSSSILADELRTQRGISFNAFPSMSPLSKKYELEAYRDKKAIIKAGASDQDLKEIYSAMKNKDQFFTAIRSEVE
ncbi:hypothetical protein [Coxiella burnetii]|uniref:Hypothetical exported protein n=2 Tax=Coxiella burnetii TaxID=777 RepID=Q83A81_COXBU|nr:hypothetical protein [Coxiella burnetii]NP_821000.1 hypothetical protein CBU_2027 [Coxiella burnetii RSA 493]AAO91514.1 hypothetical exported protein [Coxiella burnetii RSA 493]ABS77164.1 hypothetical exported protein [Coxiella burnetii Dugway 5J108-111]ABX78739.1 hypothetical protein COXBURSA331_A0057 [Coxiella burnetii RSA 331]ACJ19279.1 hypothetical exported protein [Coxiella burnetii CbuG_Q212]ACJ21178.1 hypothetical exported protein [Coxiella burnetii CbuK_Q154]